MNPITAAWLQVATDLTAAGVPATVDPGMVLTLISSDPGGVCALVEPPEAEGLAHLSARDYDLTIPIVLITSGPDDHLAVERLHERILAAIRIAPPAPPDDLIRRELRTGDAGDLPAQRWTTQRRVRP